MSRAADVRPDRADAAADEVVPARWWHGFFGITALAFVVVIVLVAARVAWFDAYWLFRETPPWLAVTGGANKLLDRQTRRAKSLQALTRNYRIAFVGSSTTYHALDPDDLAGRSAEEALNFGVSAIVADELPTMAALVASRDTTERVLLGLDYYMFSRAGVPVRLDSTLARPSGRVRALMGSVLSRDALSGSWPAAVEGADDPGAWKRNGFRVTPPLAPELTKGNDAVRRRTAASYRPETCAHLDLALTRLARLTVDVYVTPVSDAQRRVLADAGLTDDFERWRADVARIVAARGVRFMDLADLGARFPFDPAAGSNAHWLDNLHYTPVVGRLVLERLGLTVRPGLQETETTTVVAPQR